jgi:DNA-binding transcriptional regulator YiaG
MSAYEDLLKQDAEKAERRKLQKREYSRKRYPLRKEQMKAYNKVYYQEHKAERNEWCKAWKNRQRDAGYKLRELRESNGLTREEMAGKLNIDVEELRKWELGIKKIHPEVVQKIFPGWTT